MDDVYRDRAWCISLFIRDYTNWFRLDEENEGWKILYGMLPSGQVSWHISPDDWDEIFSPLDIPMKMDDDHRWDNHTTEEKFNRIKRWNTSLTKALWGARYGN